MGWLFGYYDRKSLINHLVSGNGVKTLKHCFKGNNMWAVQEVELTQGERAGQAVRFVCLYLLRGNPRVTHDPCNWGYKDVDETMGPCEVSCPTSYIELVEAHEKEFDYEPTGYAAEWRERVRTAAAKRSLKLVEGQRIRLYGEEYTVGQKVGRRQHIWQYTMCYTLPLRMMKDVEVLA